jgi:hypothetical protein
MQFIELLPGRACSSRPVCRVEIIVVCAVAHGGNHVARTFMRAFRARVGKELIVCAVENGASKPSVKG